MTYAPTLKGMNDIVHFLAGSVHSRWSGTMNLRLIIQPVMASMLAIRAGSRDARGGRSAFLWAAISDPVYRGELVHGAWKDIGPVFIIAFVLDLIYQTIVFRNVDLPEALAVATLLAILPYVLIRGPLCRILKAVREAKVQSASKN